MNDVDRLFRLYNEPLVRYLTRKLGDRDWAEEIAQETFLRALRQGELKSERSWLFAVATNLVRDDARRSARQRARLELLAAEERAREQEVVALPIERDEERAFARAAVDSLAERDRLALLMREEGLDYDEIASALDIARSSVGTTLSRARKRLAEHYEELQRRLEGRNNAAR